MAVIYYTFAAIDSTITGSNPAKTGLTPTWVGLKTTGGTQTDVHSNATITEVGSGAYQIAYDAETYGEAAGQLDLGSGLSNVLDRYLAITLSKDSTRIQTGFSSTGAVPSVTGAVGSVAGNVGGSVNGNVNGSVNSVTNGVHLDLTQSIPTSNTAQTVGDALNAARADGFGKWAIVGTTLSLYAPDGTTVVRSFTLDSSTAPTQRV